MAPGRKTGGRKTKLTPKVHETIIKAIKAGNYAKVAAQYAGIAEGTYHRWMKQGEEEESGVYCELYESVKEAESEAEVRAVLLVQEHMKDNWAAAMTYLERKFPSRWGRRTAVELTGKDGGPVVVEVPARVTVEEWADEE